MRAPYLSGILGVRVALKDVPNHGGVAFLYRPVEGSLVVLRGEQTERVVKDKHTHTHTQMR